MSSYPPPKYYYYNNNYLTNIKGYSPLQRGEVPLYSSLRRFPIIWVTLHRWQHQDGRVKETNQHSAFMLVMIIDVYLATNLVDYMDVNFRQNFNDFNFNKSSSFCDIVCGKDTSIGAAIFILTLNQMPM